MLSPLQCRNCGSHVPLAPGDVVPCPACAQAVEVPVEYRALRDSEAAAARARVDAQRLYRALGTAPSRFWRLFTFTESSIFWAFGFPVWACLGSGLSLAAQQVVARTLHANAADVLEPHQEAALTLLLPLGTIVLGLLFSGWARKRVVSLSGLQVTLAAAPAREGGPAKCRSCGAPLFVTKEDLGVRCPYCAADNLVRVEPAWLGRMQHHVQKLKQGTDAAVKALADARSSLRWSFFWRWVVGALVLSPALLIAGANDDLPAESSFDAGGRSSGQLPSWSKAIAGTRLPCTPGNLKFVRAQTEAKHCSAAGCEVFKLIAARAGETVVAASANAPEGSEVWLEVHERTFLDDVWRPLGTAVLRADQPASWKVESSAWYRVRARMADQRPATLWSFCVTAG
jgi:Zn finger protein HypA/HybF involved in hydrogenase expression